jgi:serine/threonine-protein kinase ULK4
MNNYHLYEEIGHGKHSTVYKGRRKNTIEYLAIKSIDKSKRSRVLNEVTISSDVGAAESICQVHNWYETRNHLWIVSEYCAGGDLARVLKQDEKIKPEPQLRSLAIEIVDGLIRIHAAGVVFADLKPSNVLFNEAGKVKLSGFSVSQRLGDLEAALLANQQVARRGSPFYMAPELFTETGFHSKASDLYALGVVLFEMHSGRTPYGSCSSFADLQRSVISQSVLAPELTDSSDELRHLVGRLLVKDPCDRIGWQELVSHPWWSGDSEKVLEWKQIVRTKIVENEMRFKDKFLVTRSRRRGSSFDLLKQQQSSGTPISQRSVARRSSLRE